MWEGGSAHPGYHYGRSSPLADQIEMLVVVVGIAVTTPASITAFKIARPGQLSADSP
jgi:hypothetical protein